MKLGRTLRCSVRALLSHRLRVGLALSSVAMGTAGVLLTSAIGQGAQNEMLRSIEAMGTDLLVVKPAATKALVARKQVRGLVTTLAVDDHAAIAELALAGHAIPSASAMPVRVKAGRRATTTSLFGTSPEYLEVRHSRLQQGRFFTVDDDREMRRVAVLGSKVQEILFGEASSIGEWIRVRSVPFEVIGVLESKGVLADGADEDNQVVVPLRTALRRVLNSRALSAVSISVRDPEQMDEADAEIKALLRDRHRLEMRGKPDDFVVQNKVKLLVARQEVARTLTLAVSSLAGLALVVGGTGILALMLLAVKERTREIGLRMALGARPRDILIQFIAEAGVLALGGWAVGTVIGGVGAVAVAYGTEWKTSIPIGGLVITLAMSVVIGLGFGAYPARKASLLTPTEALGTE